MVNKVTLVGYAGADPEVRTLESGVTMARLRMATSESYYSAVDQCYKSHTEWHTVVFWKTAAEYVGRNVVKGTLIYVEGRLRSREVPASSTSFSSSSVHAGSAVSSGFSADSSARSYAPRLVEVVGDQVKILGGERRGGASSVPNHVASSNSNSSSHSSVTPNSTSDLCSDLTSDGSEAVGSVVLENPDKIPF